MQNHALTNFTYQTPETAAPEAAELLNNAKETIGFVPNMYAIMANLPSLLTNYNNGYYKFRETGEFTPVEQEVVYLTISRLNGCDYCTAAHSLVGDKMSGVPADVLAALRSGAPLSDPKLQTLVNFTTEMLETRGQPSEQALNEFASHGFTQTNAMGIILAISAKVLSNYSNRLAGTKVDAAFESYKV